MTMSVEMSEHGGETCPTESNNLHLKSFKLRFAAQREPGRSYVSAVKPLGLPAVVRAKECVSGTVTRAGEREEKEREEKEREEKEREEHALRRVEALFRRGPRDKYPTPLTTAHEYGWWVRTDATFPPPETRHHIRDSAWLKERLRVLASKDGLEKR